jgi:predicted DNA-binding transcriptional regulator YafY
VRLPPHGLTPEELAASRFGLAALAPRTCKRLAPQYRAFKEFLHDDVRLDRAPGIEQSGNQK